MLQARKIMSIPAQQYKLPNDDPLDNPVDYALFVLMLVMIAGSFITCGLLVP